MNVEAYVERVPHVQAVTGNASGDRMQSVDAVKMEVGLNGVNKRIGFHVGSGLDKNVILEINALDTFGIQLVPPFCQPRIRVW